MPARGRCGVPLVSTNQADLACLKRGGKRESSGRWRERGGGGCQPWRVPLYERPKGINGGLGLSFMPEILPPNSGRYRDNHVLSREGCYPQLTPTRMRVRIYVDITYFVEAVKLQYNTLHQVQCNYAGNLKPTI